MISSTPANMEQFCRLENRTMILNICKQSPRIIQPICVGYCSSTSHYNFRLHQFITRTESCRVTQYRTEYFVCPDSTHTAIELLIPLACSCEKRHCHG
jgi:hypothetical protein